MFKHDSKTRENLKVAANSWRALTGVLGALGVLAVMSLSLFQAVPEARADDATSLDIVIYKHEACGCCGLWSKHLSDYGFNVREVNVANPNEVKLRYGVNFELASCHTAIAGDYIIEGHVPADLIAKVLREKPAIRGLAVPAMPIGSPGMEGPNPVTYHVFAFDAEGNKTVYATRKGNSGT